jgi:hypothetical protein
VLSVTRDSCSGDSRFGQLSAAGTEGVSHWPAHEGRGLPNAVALTTYAAASMRRATVTTTAKATTKADQISQNRAPDGTIRRQ